MPLDHAAAAEFVRSIDLSGTPSGLMEATSTSRGFDDLNAAPVAAVDVFDKAKAQAQVVGAGVFSFSEGVTPEVREAISDSALLAQLWANKQVSAQEKPLEWFTTYFDALEKIGWVLQDSSWTDYTAQGKAVQVHEKISEIMAAALGPSPAALAIVKSTVDALKGLDPNSPWLAIFNRESQKASIARFQIGLVEKDQNDDVFVSLLACLIQAHSNITQVLFFKFRDSGASFKANTGKVSINRTSLANLVPIIRQKIRAYQTDYLSSILNL
jgi:hypothetical protein